MAGDRNRTDPRTTWQWKAARDRYLNQARRRQQHTGKPPTCHHCGQPIDLNARYKINPRRINPWCPTVEHITPLTRGGDCFDPNNWALAHHKCNSRQGGQLAKQQTQRVNHTSRDW